MILSSPPSPLRGPLGRLGLARLGGVVPHRPGLARLGQTFGETETERELCQVAKTSGDHKLRLAAVLNLANSAMQVAGAGGATDWYLCNCFLATLHDPEPAVRASSAVAIAQLSAKARGVCADASGFAGPRTRVAALLALLDRLDPVLEDSATVRRMSIDAIGRVATAGDVAVIEESTGRSIYSMIVASLNAVASTDTDEASRAEALRVRDEMMALDPGIGPPTIPPVRPPSPIPPAVTAVSPMEKGLVIAGGVALAAGLGLLVFGRS